jgi:ATP-dependent Lon protease
MPGSKGFVVTGSVGNVMQESARAALSLVRSHSQKYGIPADFFDKSDIHVHIPAGAQPKDGPSAGVTIVTALVSLMTNRPVHSDVGMTGEITLRGQVMPIGGLKDKVLAAHRAGLKTILLPRHNEPDLEELPEEVRKSMKFVLVDQIDDVLKNALESPLASNQDQAVLWEEPADEKGASAPVTKTRKTRSKKGTPVQP